MTVPQESPLQRRHFANLLKAISAASTLTVLVSLPPTSLGQQACASCDKPLPTCGVESPNPSCGCDALWNPGYMPAPAPVCVRPRSLSFAEKILRRLDRIGDQIEYEASVSSSCACCSGGVAHPQAAGAATSGCESPGFGRGVGMPSCGCGPSVPFGIHSPMSQGQRGTHGQSFTADSSKRHGRPGQGGSTGVSEVGPMFPDKPQDLQAIGKLSDQPGAAPRMEKPVIAPAPQVPPLETSKPQSTDSQLLSPFSPPVPLPDNDAKSVNDRPRLLPTPSEEHEFRSSDKSAPLSPPALPEAQDEIPDVLIDPFKDDASWRGKRDRMNGVRLSSGEIAIPLRNSTNDGAGARPKLLPTPHDDDVGVVVEPPPVFTKPAVINRYRQWNDEMSPRVDRIAVPRKKD